MGFLFEGHEYYAFACREGEIYEITEYCSISDPRKPKALLPHARENPMDLPQWVAANRYSYIRRGECAWILVSEYGIRIIIDDKLEFWVEKWT